MELWIGLAFFLLIDVVIVIFVLVKIRTKKFSATEQQKFSEYWQRIKQESDSAKAVMAADILLDKVLKRKGYKGSLGEKLKKAAPLFSSNNDVWFAHKLRNRLAHELHAEVSSVEASKALQAFKRALQDLGVKL